MFDILVLPFDQDKITRETPLAKIRSTRETARQEGEWREEAKSTIAKRVSKKKKRGDEQMSVSTTVTRIRRYAEIQNTANEKLLVLYPLSLPGNVSAVTLPSRCVVYLYMWKRDISIETDVLF